MNIVETFNGSGYNTATSTYEGPIEASNLLSVYRKLDNIRDLGDNWNLDGARPIGNSIIELIRRMIPKLVILPEIFPTGRSTIQLEYDGDDDAYLEIEIMNEKKQMYY